MNHEFASTQRSMSVMLVEQQLLTMCSGTELSVGHLRFGRAQKEVVVSTLVKQERIDLNH